MSDGGPEGTGGDGGTGGDPGAGRGEREPEPQRRVSGSALALGCLLAAAAAIVVLWWAAGSFDPGRLHLAGMSSRLNDQAGYVTTARILADTGELRNGLLMPAFIDNPASRVYMPGHYAALALSYSLFGYGVFPSLLPNLLACVLCATALFWIGARRYGLFTGAVGTALFLCFPPHLLFAFTAMAESTLQAAALSALALLLVLAPRARPIAVPVLVAVPFLFRETGALWVLPMLAVAWRRTGRGAPWIRSLAMLLATVGLLVAVQRWQEASGKESPPLSWLTGSGFNYGDVQAAEDPESSFTLAEFPGLLVANVERNLDNLRDKVLDDPWGFEGSAVLAIGALILACLLIGVPRVRRDPLLLAAGLTGLGTWCLAFGLYDVVGLKLLRSSLFFVPLCALALVGQLEWRGAASGARGLGHLPRLLAGVLLALLFATWTVPTCRAAGEAMCAADAETDARLALLEEAGHDDRTLLVAPWLFGLEYAVQHYPVPYAFPPKNPRSLRALDAAIPIGTLILRRNQLDELPLQAIGDLGLRQVTELKGGKGAATFLVFQRGR